MVLQAWRVLCDHVGLLSIVPAFVRGFFCSFDDDVYIVAVAQCNDCRAGAVKGSAVSPLAILAIVDSANCRPTLLADRIGQ